MRTPLTVISGNIQRVTQTLEDMGKAVKDQEAVQLLAAAQSEIMRLARMVGGMLTLASINEETQRSRANFTTIIQSTADMLLLILEKRGNRLETEVEEDFYVFCNRDLLTQVIMNLIQNANDHTMNDTILLCVIRDGGTLTVTVSDNGAGISSDLLPRVFERGVSGKEGGTGYGLFLCKTVVESHGGRIWMENGSNGGGQGTSVYFTLPVYEGQYGDKTK
jgi:signal transduction histidine kinase